MMKNLSAIVLAAGKGTRMKSQYPKVIHKLCGMPMVFYPLKVLEDLKCRQTLCLTGHQSKLVREVIASLPLKKQPTFASQSKQLGTGHAVKVAFQSLKAKPSDDILILSGDVPQIQKETIKKLINGHKKDKNTVLSFISFDAFNPKGYGRVIRDSSDNIVSITEDKDLKASEKHITEVNSGIYIMQASFLKKYLPKINNKNKQKEYYLTDLIALALGDKQRVNAVNIPWSSELDGINDRLNLSSAEYNLRYKLLEKLMLSGVTVVESDNTFVDFGVKVGADTILEPGVILKGNTVVGKNCIIESGARIVNSKIGDDCHIKANSNIESSTLKKNVTAGPFARVRPESIIEDNAHIGNFVEIKKSKIGKGSKASHLSYIGDSIIGKKVNIGAGVITCNYDGVNKHITRIDDGAFIGSDSQLVAPVRVGKNAYIGSGSTITKDVPPSKLAVARAPQKTFNIKKKKKK